MRKWIYEKKLAVLRWLVSSFKEDIMADDEFRVYLRAAVAVAEHRTELTTGKNHELIVGKVMMQEKGRVSPEIVSKAVKKVFSQCGIVRLP